MPLTFSKDERTFLKEELGFSEENLDVLSEDEIYDLGDRCFDIEAEELALAGSGDLSRRGKLASDLVTKINYADG